MFKKINEGACNYKITGNINGHDIEFIPEDKYTTLLEQAEKLADALDDIAAWHDGDEVDSGFDEPCSATIAREALSVWKEFNK